MTLISHDPSLKIRKRGFRKKKMSAAVGSIMRWIMVGTGVFYLTRMFAPCNISGHWKEVDNRQQGPLKIGCVSNAVKEITFK